MRGLSAALILWLVMTGARSARSAAKPFASAGFPQTVRVRMWYLHPPPDLRVFADAGQAQQLRCASCRPAGLTSLIIHAAGSQVQIEGGKSASPGLSLRGAYQLNAIGEPPFRGDFPLEIRARSGHLVVIATMPMEEYIAGVLAGEAGNFKSDEALKALAVAARTYAIHFGSRHAIDGFDLCDTTHCQDLRVSGINDRLRRIAASTSGEILWYDGEPAASYYHANCGGTTEDGRFILGNGAAPAPFLRQHPDQYCVRNGGSQWHTEVSKRALQRALASDGIAVPGQLRAVSVIRRTPSGRVEFLRVTGSSPVTVPALTFRLAIGQHIGWERLKSNWYDIGNAGDAIAFHGRGSGHGVGLCQIGAEVMGEEGHSYREILSFYYPGTKLGADRQAVVWQQLTGENVVLLTTQPDRDRSLLPLVARMVGEAEQSTGLEYRSAPRLKVYATVSAFRNSTGEPGWVAASTRGRTIHVQPPDVLQQVGTLESTLRHELLHMLIESYVRPGTPLWFREGLVLYLGEPRAPVPERGSSEDLTRVEQSLRSATTEQELRQAYAKARARVSQLAQQYGAKTLLLWVENGLPAELTGKIVTPVARR